MLQPIVSKYRQTKQRLFLLDYDGVLVGFKPTPPEAIPTPEVLDLLRKLGSDPQNTVVIVSGRDHQTLGDWLGRLPVTLMAEHGFYIKQRDAPWRLTAEQNETWKETILPILHATTHNVTGSLIEEKTTSLVWHYRTANSEAGEAAAKALHEQLINNAADLGLEILAGNKNIEIRLLGTNKGTAAQSWLSIKPWDFILAAGDDTTDEDMFRALPSSALTVKVGPGETAARLRAKTPKDFVEILSQC